MSLEWYTSQLNRGLPAASFSDQRGPADYKRHLVEELTRRALRRSVARSQGQEA